VLVEAEHGAAVKHPDQVSVPPQRSGATGSVS
jgi:hypothetical protein